MTERAANPMRETQFFRNYNRLVGGTYLAILVLIGLFFTYQIQQQYEEEVESIRGHVTRHGQFIEFILRSSLDTLEGMRIAATEAYATAPATSEGMTAAVAPQWAMLRATPRGFAMDGAIERDANGNLVGLGSLHGRGTAFYQDAYVALSLGPVFQSIAFNLPNAARASFTSAERFSNVYPWEESATRPFDPAIYQAPEWTLGTPERNRNREKYWAPVHYAGPQNGLLVPIAAPVYHGAEFRGVVSIETSLDYLNRINGDFGYRAGTVFLVDAGGQVVAHPGFFADALKVQSTHGLQEALPAGVLRAGQSLTDIPADLPSELGGQLVIRHGFVSAPWQLVYTIPKAQLMGTLLWAHGPLMALIFLALTLLMVVTYAVTMREFIAPASRLVRHIARESRFTPSPIPAVPAPWRPWFETISQAFRESVQLAGIRQELDIAAKMQQSILPRHWPAVSEFSLWGVMRSAKEVGGDFYDHFPLDGGHIGIVVADVSGKGVPAALFGMVSKTLLRATAPRHPDELGEAIARVNDILAQDNDACIFVTVFYGVYNPASGRLTYVNAGHPPPLIVHADGSTGFIATTLGTALGVMDGIPFAQKTISLVPGDLLLMYSDGVTEAMSPVNEEFTPDRLPDVFAQRRADDVHAAVEDVIAAVDRHAAGAPQSDDITCVALRCQRAAPGEPVPADDEQEAIAQP